MIKIKKSKYQFADMNPLSVTVRGVNYIVSGADEQSVRVLNENIAFGKIKIKKNERVLAFIQKWI